MRSAWVRLAAGVAAVVASVVAGFASAGLMDLLKLPVLALIVAYLVPGLIFLRVLDRVSYRSRDWLLISLVPIWGQFVVPFRVGWRLAGLPIRDWPPRPDEPYYAEWFAVAAKIAP
jgi:hypothetical protein